MALGIVGGSIATKTAATGTYTAGSGSNRQVVAILSHKSGDAPTHTITLNGVVRTPSVQKNESGVVDPGEERDSVAICQWFESELAGGAMNYSVQSSGSLGDCSLCFYTLSDAAQTAATGGAIGSTAGFVDGSGLTAALNLTTAIGDICFACVAFRSANGEFITQPAGWTEDYDLTSADGNSGGHAGAHFTASGTTTGVQFTDPDAASQYACCAIAVGPYTGGSSSILMQMLQNH